MGVKGLFGGYILRRHRDCVLRARPADFRCDHLLIDLNGIIHTSCAAVYGYGDRPRSEERGTSFLRPRAPPTVADVERSIVDRLRYLIQISAPQRGVFIAIDGVAPVSKQCQQRARRYRAAMTRDPNLQFDSNCITPGSEFLSDLSRGLYAAIRSRLAKEHPSLDFFLANQNVAGEGEHKAIQFIRKNAEHQYQYVLYGMDADLINLALASPAEHIFIARETHQGSVRDFHWVDITTIRGRIQADMFWEGPSAFCDLTAAIRDFVLLGYFLGNDFLPQVKCLNIYDGAIDHMLTAYREAAPRHGHLVTRYGERWYVNTNLLYDIVSSLQSREHDILADLAQGVGGRHKDEVLVECLTLSAKRSREDFDYGRCVTLHAERKLRGNARDAVLRYMEGMEWIVNYYLEGPISWTWYYPYHYAPLLAHFLAYMREFRSVAYPATQPHAPILQLLSVLPPKSAGLLPEPFRSLVVSEGFELRDQFPDTVEVDLGGCKADWEATVLAPFLDQRAVSRLYSRRVREVDDAARKRNAAGRSFHFTQGRIDFYAL